MFWAAFGYGMYSDLAIYYGNPESRGGDFTARKYKAALDRYFPQVLDTNSIFIQDNTRVYTARLIQD